MTATGCETGSGPGRSRAKHWLPACKKLSACLQVFLPVRDAEGLHVDWGVLAGGWGPAGRPPAWSCLAAAWVTPLHACCSPAGYEEQKRQIEDTVLLALANPEVYDRIAARTKARGAQAAGSNRPRAVLFEGPPGTGKTTSARWGLLGRERPGPCQP